jgi:hypothetical protein
MHLYEDHLQVECGTWYLAMYVFFDFVDLTVTCEIYMMMHSLFTNIELRQSCMLNISTVVMLMLRNFDCIFQLSSKVFYNTTITKHCKIKDKIIPASYSMGTGRPFPGVKRGRGVTLITLVLRPRISRSYISSPPWCLHGDNGTA